MNNPRDKHLSRFRAGSHVGPYHLLRYLGNVLIGVDQKRKTDLFATRCMRCGHERDVNGKALRQSQVRNICSCPYCSSATKTDAPIEPERVSKKPCSHCYDLPHRRPLTGLCRCGEAHGEEEIHVESFIYNSQNGLLAQLIRDNGCREEKVEGRKYGAQHRGPYRASQEFEAMT